MIVRRNDNSVNTAKKVFEMVRAMFEDRLGYGFYMEAGDNEEVTIEVV